MSSDSKPREEFETGAVRRKVEPSLISHIPVEAILALGERYYLGAVKRSYGPWNWAQGIPYTNLIQHAGTHLFLLGNQLSSPVGSVNCFSEDTPRENAAAVMWGMASIIHFLVHGNPAEQRQT